MAATQARKLGPFLATMFVTGNMVGSGLFLLPATLGSIGGISIFTWIFATLGALLIACVFARLGVLAPWAGGPFAYARATMGRYFGFQTNYVYWLSVWIGNVGIALAATGYLTELLPALHTPFRSACVTSCVIWLMIAANIAGPRVVAGLEATTILLGLAPALALGVVGWWYFDPAIFRASWNVSGQPAIEAVPGSLVLVFWAFTGLETAAVAAEVVDNPTRNLPIAAVAGVAIAAVVYASTCTVLMGIIPARELAASSAPFALVARHLFGPVAGLVLTFTAILKASGTHGGWTLVTVATAKAAADKGAFPSVFARVDRRGVPVKSLLVHGTLMTLAAFVTMSPTVGQQFSRLVDVSVVFCMVTYAYSAFALFRLSAGRRTGARRDRVLAVLAILFSLWVILASDPTLLAIAGLIMLSSMPLFPFFRGHLDAEIAVAPHVAASAP
jgi:arginine:agmatine antiporter